MIALILTLALLGLIVYLITTYIPMPPIFKTVIYVIVAVVIILYLMRVFGISDIPLPRAH
jgi:predicted membrane channel-forming protein YqfA (hemolysin III family)